MYCVHTRDYCGPHTVQAYYEQYMRTHVTPNLADNRIDEAVKGGSQIPNGCPKAEHFKFLRFIGPTPLKTQSPAPSAFLTVQLVDKSKNNSLHRVSRRQLRLQAPK